MLFLCTLFIYEFMYYCLTFQVFPEMATRGFLCLISFQQSTDVGTVIDDLFFIWKVGHLRVYNGLTPVLLISIE